MEQRTTLVGSSQSPARMSYEILGTRLTEMMEPSFGELRKYMSTVVIGQEQLVKHCLVGLLAGGHCLIEGVPGLAKTLTVKTLAQSLSGAFSRIQFTPDLLPADITGTTIYNLHTGQFTTKKGPLFANLVLADEINRAPAKVQSALLEAMQERQVTIGDQTFVLPDPFLVVATQNPIEQEGTFTLPEAQLDRFMLLIKVGYPSKHSERSMLDNILDATVPAPAQHCSLENVLQAQALTRQVFVDPRIRQYILDLTAATRTPAEYNCAELTSLIENGASPRATICLAAAARAVAALESRAFVIPDDVKEIALEVLRHRIIPTFEADAEEITSDDIVQRILAKIPTP